MKGRLEDMAVADIIQHTCNDRMAARVDLKNGARKAALFFKNGNLVHATLENLRGEEVVYSVLAWEQGTFDLKNEVEPPDISITREWSSLLLEGARRWDEGLLQGVVEDTTPPVEREFFQLVSSPAKPIEQSDVQFPFTINPELSRTWATTEGYDPANQKTAELAHLFQELAQSTDGFLGAAVANLKGEILLRTESNEAELTQIVDQLGQFVKMLAGVAIKLGAGSLEDDLLTTEKAYLHIRFIGASLYLIAITDRKRANLGSMRHQSKVCADGLARFELEHIALGEGR